jgi:hypothetical protein
LKNKVQLRLNNPKGLQLFAPGYTSFNITVPDSVQSDFHNSVQFTLSFAAKSKLQLTFIAKFGFEVVAPGNISFSNSGGVLGIMGITGGVIHEEPAELEPEPVYHEKSVSETLDG